MLRALPQRLRGREVTMVTGTDEHGEKIALSAAKAGLDPKAHCDAIVQEYKHLWQLVRTVSTQPQLADLVCMVLWWCHAPAREGASWWLTHLLLRCSAAGHPV